LKKSRAILAALFVGALVTVSAQGLYIDVGPHLGKAWYTINDYDGKYYDYDTGHYKTVNRDIRGEGITFDAVGLKFGYGPCGNIPLYVTGEFSLPLSFSHDVSSQEFMFGPGLIFYPIPLIQLGASLGGVFYYVEGEYTGYHPGYYYSNGTYSPGYYDEEPGSTGGLGFMWNVSAAINLEKGNNGCLIGIKFLNAPGIMSTSNVQISKVGFFVKYAHRQKTSSSTGKSKKGTSSSAAESGAYQNIDIAVNQNDFERGVAALRAGQEGRRPLYPEKNAVSLYLDKGLLEHYAGNYKDSAQDLIQAERLIQEAFTKSVTADIASYIANDNTKEYPGEDYEDLYINVFNALNFYNNGNTEGALVEIRKLTLSSEKLDMLSRKYEERTKSAGDYLMNGLNKIGLRVNPQLPQGNPVNFSNSALARYLSVLFYLDDRNEDSARIEFDQLKAAFTANSKVYYNPIPKSIDGMRTIPSGKARLNIIGFAGLSPVKEEKDFGLLAPLEPPFSVMKLKLPVLKKRPSAIKRIEVEVQGQGKFELELLEDMTAVTEETYNARFANMFFKTYVRILLKNAAAAIAAEQVSKKAGGLAGLGAFVAGKVAADASESADIRMGRYLPDKAYVGAIDLEPGTYTIKVNFGRSIKEFKDVNVKAGRINLIEAVSLQ
jgi:hypothetical protein